jgi:hypothetical protein
LRLANVIWREINAPDKKRLQTDNDENGR